jgi:hypothetical protein
MANEKTGWGETGQPVERDPRPEQGTGTRNKRPAHESAREGDEENRRPRKKRGPQPPRQRDDGGAAG